MDYFITLALDLLNALKHITGSYGYAIIVLTVLIRVVLWPSSVSQQRSMKKMQTLGPKLKELQTKYKNDPHTMQKKMAEFYKEHKFNPFGGCLPMLIQLPLFIALYSALSSPLFILESGQSSFWFIDKLYAPIKSHAGVIGDKKFGIEKHDTFSIFNKITIYTGKDKIEDIKLDKPEQITKHLKNLIPGKPLDLVVPLDKIDADYNQLKAINKAEILVINNNSKEVEKITFNKADGVLSASIPTEKVKTNFHYDVLALVILFGITMFFSQKVMTATNKNAAADPAQQAMQDQMTKMLPLMILATFVFMPIPAGVLLYMVVSNIFQIIQTVIINKQMENEENGSKIDVTKAPSTKIAEATANSEEVIIEHNGESK